VLASEAKGRGFESSLTTIKKGRRTSGEIRKCPLLLKEDRGLFHLVKRLGTPGMNVPTV
jgi:hypothetical protein